MRARYDQLMDRFLKEEAVFVVDSGATAFLPFWTFMVEADVLRLCDRPAGESTYTFPSAAERC